MSIHKLRRDTVENTTQPLQTCLDIMEALRDANLVVVPHKPTEEMVVAALTECPDLHRDTIMNAYRAMLKAE